MTKLDNQRGVGLVEVMVALLLLAVAVLGFSALQLNALSATDESLVRSRAMSMSKQLSENMRLNTLATNDFMTELNTLNQGATNITEYCTKVAQASSRFDQDSCKSDACSAEEIAQLNAWQAASLGCEQDIMLNMTTCPDMADINARQCIITSWGKTLPVLDDSEDNACGNSSGAYKAGANCLIMESY
ncbi:MAG: type IV pilus modification protein PilV [Psychrobacter sp.]|jgi:type IV pilus assembly protein PilV|uniref:type IV pilus modification protein PilV n=1 Tax=uncultured Psychrobacter sp. TaxID=259303 RepID=UPI002636967C|nr:type IV pilus modification protein PilV [uncultured Psychrobacter sp.]